MKLLVSLLLVVVACNNDQQGTQPAPPLTTEAGVPALVPVGRTVGHRNPFGDALQSDNMMVDGDFELTGRTDQAPWVVFNQTQQTLNYDTGGRCRSGIRCAVIGKGDQLVGFLTSPALANFVVRVYVKPENSSCHEASVIVVDLATNNTGGSAQPVSPTPDADGWCLFQGSSSSIAYGEPAVFVSLATSAQGATLHVDQASVLIDGEAPIHGITAMTRAPADVIARANVAANWIRAHRKFGRTTPRSAP